MTAIARQSVPPGSFVETSERSESSGIFAAESVGGGIGNPFPSIGMKTLNPAGYTPSDSPGASMRNKWTYVAKFETPARIVRLLDVA